MNHLLDIQNLKISFQKDNEPFEVVHGIDFVVNEGEIVAVVGESGSGKSISALAITGLLPGEPNCVVSGKVLYEGIDLLALPNRQIRGYRGGKIAYVFQEPSASMHPQMKIGEQMREVIRLHRPNVRDVKRLIVKSLDEVGIREPEMQLKRYPHQFSGGMLQRVMIAMALVCRPKLLIADEPTTALDVSIQAQILDLIKQVQQEYGLSVLMITHNFGIVDGFADRLLVMQRGSIVEQGNVLEVLQCPEHPYTKGLIDCIPQLGKKRKRLLTFNESIR